MVRERPRYSLFVYLSVIYQHNNKYYVPTFLLIYNKYVNKSFPWVVRKIAYTVHHELLRKKIEEVSIKKKVLEWPQHLIIYKTEEQRRESGHNISPIIIVCVCGFFKTLKGS